MEKEHVIEPVTFRRQTVFVQTLWRIPELWSRCLYRAWQTITTAYFEGISGSAAAIMGLLWNSRQHNRSQGDCSTGGRRDGCLVYRLQFSEGRLGLYPRVGEGVNTAGFQPVNYNFGEDGVFQNPRATRAAIIGVSLTDHSWPSEHQLVYTDEWWQQIFVCILVFRF